MTTEYEKAICEFLAKKENLAIALEVGSHVDKVIEQVGNRFWEGVQAALQRKLRETRLDEKWRQEIWKEGGAIMGTVLCPKMAKDSGALFAYECAEEEGKANRHHLGEGIWLPTVVPKVAKSEAADLQRSLAEEGCRSYKEYVGWKYVREYTSVNEFVVAIAEGGDEFVASIAETFWDFFEATRAKVERLNALLPMPGGQARKRR